jgi:hypothetical protein
MMMFDIPTAIDVPRRVDLAHHVMTGDDTATLMGVALTLMSIAASKDGETVLDSIDILRSTTVFAEQMVYAHWDTFRKYEERRP